MIKIITITLFLIVGLVECRITQQTFTGATFVRQQGWIYLDKMVLAKGTIEIEFQTKILGDLSEPIQLEFGYLNDESFQSQSKHRCANTEAGITVHSHSLLPKKQPSKTKISFQNQAQQMYYFVLKDCDKQIITQKPLPGITFKKTISVQTKLTIKNAGSHLGNQQDIWIIYPILIVLSLCLIIKIRQQKPTEGEKNWVQIVLMLGILARIAALFWKSLGYYLYYKIGRNFLLFEIIYLALHGGSQVAIICIVILIGFGWYILFTNHQDFDIFLTLLSLLGLMNVILNVLNVINNDTHDKYHMYDTIPSYIQTVFRLLAFVIFLIGVLRIWPKLNPDRRHFMIKFSMYGGIYILSLPAILLFSKYFVRTQRQQIVFIISELFQLGSNFLMTHLLTSKGSAYNKITISNSSFVPSDKNEKYF